MTRSRVVPALLLAILACGGRAAEASPDAAPAFVVDGSFLEWAGVPESATDGRDVAAPDLTGVRMVVDGDAVRLLLDFDAPVNLQSMAGTLRLALDGDGDETTGERVAALAGADVVIEFSANPEAAAAGTGMRVRFAGDSAWHSPYALDLAYAPTHSSGRFEVSLERTRFRGDTVRGLIVMTDAAGAPVEVFGPFAVAAPPPRQHAPERTVRTTLARAPGTALRVVAWNVGESTPVRRPEPFRRILGAVAPDVVLLDELAATMDAAQVRALLPDGPPWRVVLGTGGGRQRTAVAARLPLEPAPGMERIAWPDSIAVLDGAPMVPQLRTDLAAGTGDGVPAVGAIVSSGGLRILVVPVDLPCCGRAGSAEDRARIMMATAVNEAARRAVARAAIDAVIVGGDMNLVGSRSPLTTLAAGLDPSGDALTAAPLRTPDGATYSTWRAPGPFPPGRLDWLLYAGSRLEQVGGFVFDAGRLADSMRSAAGLEPDDSEVTDHLPLVLDLAVRAQPTR